MGNRIICIGRAFGSGGHEVAVRLSERLGLKVYEKHLLYLACEYAEALYLSLYRQGVCPASPNAAGCFPSYVFVCKPCFSLWRRKPCHGRRRNLSATFASRVVIRLRTAFEPRWSIPTRLTV